MSEIGTALVTRDGLYVVVVVIIMVVVSDADDDNDNINCWRSVEFVAMMAVV